MGEEEEFQILERGVLMLSVVGESGVTKLEAPGAGGRHWVLVLTATPVDKENPILLNCETFTCRTLRSRIRLSIPEHYRRRKSLPWNLVPELISSAGLSCGVECLSISWRSLRQLGSERNNSGWRSRELEKKRQTQCSMSNRRTSVIGRPKVTQKSNCFSTIIKGRLSSFHHHS